MDDNFGKEGDYFKAYNQIIVIKVEGFNFINKMGGMFHKGLRLANEGLKFIGQKMRKGITGASFGTNNGSERNNFLWILGWP